MTRSQSNNQWNGGIAAHHAPKNSECKNPLEKFSPRFFGIKTASSHWLSSIGPNYQRGVLIISAGAIEGRFEGKTPREGHRALATQKKLTYLGFQCLDHPPCSPDLAPSHYQLFPGLKKKICCRGDLVGRTTFWIFLSGLQKLEQRAKKCIKLRGDCIEEIPSSVAVACFLPGRAKDLSAPLPTGRVWQHWNICLSRY